MSPIDLRCQDVTAMLASLPDACSPLIVADPPWLYSGGLPTNHSHAVTFKGRAQEEYPCLSNADIAGHLAATFRVAAPDSYLAVWATFPKLFEWARQDGIMQAAGWQYVSGAAWGKINGLGVGHHFRGDAELLLLYKKGNPHPLNGGKSNLWLADRQGHSEKPQAALRALVSMGAPVDGLVVDLYAGESASLARACRSLGRAYVGAEIDPIRWERARRRLSQQDMFTQVPA